jgi:lipoate-protein ligase A
MHCLNLLSTDPFFNLAAEEYLLKRSTEEYLVLYINSPSVIIGKHQVAHREADTEYVTRRNIPVIRRISGGGTVFHDKGNLNFTFIINGNKGSQVDFRKYTLPVIQVLSTLGVEAKFEGKNDLKVNGLKISGNAEHVYHERVLHHGTLLFNSQLDVLRKSLRADKSHYSTRAVSSNPSSVINLKETISGVKDISGFRQHMLEYFLDHPGNKIFELSSESVNEINSLTENKFRTWEWNYAYGPDYHFNNSFELTGKPHSCHLSVKDGIICDCEIKGSDEIIDAGKKLIGCRHMPQDLLIVFKRLVNKDIFVKWMF